MAFVTNVDIKASAMVNTGSGSHNPKFPIIRLSDDTLFTAGVLSTDGDKIYFYYSNDEGQTWNDCSTGWDYGGDTNVVYHIHLDRTPSDDIFVAYYAVLNGDLYMARLSFSGTDITVEDDATHAQSVTELYGIKAIDHPDNAGNWFVYIFAEESTVKRAFYYECDATTGFAVKSELTVQTNPGQGGAALAFLYSGDQYTPASASAPQFAIFYSNNDDDLYMRLQDWNSTNEYPDPGTQRAVFSLTGAVDDVSDVWWCAVDSKWYIFTNSGSYQSGTWKLHYCDDDGLNAGQTTNSSGDPGGTLSAMNLVYDSVADEFYLIVADATTPQCRYDVFDRSAGTWAGWTTVDSTQDYTHTINNGTLGVPPPTSSTGGTTIGFTYHEASPGYMKWASIVEIAGAVGGIGWGWVPIGG